MFEVVACTVQLMNCACYRSFGPCDTAIPCHGGPGHSDPMHELGNGLAYPMIPGHGGPGHSITYHNTKHTIY